MNCSPSTITTVTLSLPPALIGGLDQLARRRFGIARVPLHSLANPSEGTWSLRPSLHSSRAESGSNGDPPHLDEVGVVRRMLLGADVAKDLVAARVAHRLGLATARAVSSRSPTGE